MHSTITLRHLSSRINWHLSTGPDSYRRLFRLLRSGLVCREYLSRKRVANELRDPPGIVIPERQGFAVVPQRDFPEIPEIIRLSHEKFSGSLDSISRQRGVRPYATIAPPKEFVDLSSPFMQLALNRKLTTAISRYLGAVPVLKKIEYWIAPPNSVSGGIPYGSQRYHCDDGDIRQVKLFVNLSDVTEANGPLVMLPAAESLRVRRKLRYKYRQMLPDAAIHEHIDEQDAVAFTGLRGTTVLADTSRCFHYGGRVRKNAETRITLFYHYIVPGAFKLALDHRSETAFSHLNSPDLSPLQRMVLGIAPSTTHRD